MNVALRALIRPPGIRTLVRPTLLRNPPLRFSSSNSTPSDAAADLLSQNPYSLEPQSPTSPPEENTVVEESNSPDSHPGLVKIGDFLVSHVDLLRQHHAITSTEQDKNAITSQERYKDAITDCLIDGKDDDAYKQYDQMKAKGISPDTKLAITMLRFLCQRPTSGTADKALKIYRDLANALPTNLLQLSQPYSRGMTPGVYNRLFRILLASPDHAPMLPSLIKEMEEHGLPENVGVGVTATFEIIKEMREKKLFAEAIDVYRQHRSKLTAWGFYEILQEYCRLSFVGALDIPLITQYFSIVNDMRLRRMDISHNIYGLIIKHITLMVTKIKRGQADPQAVEAIPRLVSTIRRVHDFLTLDASLSPDPTLWNRLMDAYQRLGCFGDAYRLWEMMYLTGTYTQITVTIMLDACGYAGEYHRARSIINKLERAGFSLDDRNWKTWVECLCRLSRFEEALHVAFVQMPRRGLEPDIEIFRVLHKFSKRDGISREFHARVEKDFPQLWSRFPDLMRNS